MGVSCWDRTLTAVGPGADHASSRSALEARYDAGMATDTPQREPPAALKWLIHGRSAT